MTFNSVHHCNLVTMRSIHSFIRRPVKTRSQCCWQYWIRMYGLQGALRPNQYNTSNRWKSIVGRDRLAFLLVVLVVDAFKYVLESKFQLKLIIYQLGTKSNKIQFRKISNGLYYNPTFSPRSFLIETTVNSLD